MYMKALKKFLLGVTALTMALGLMACGGGENDSSSQAGSSEIESSSEVESLEDAESSENEVDEGMTEIVNAAYALASGEAMEGEYTLTGVITKLDSYNNPTIVVNGLTDKPIYCYKLKDETFKIGDTITVTGKIKNYNGTVEFDNPTLVSHEAGETPETPDIPENPTTPAEIVDMAYMLTSGMATDKEYTLTGVITEAGVFNTSYGDINVTIVIEGKEDKPMYCYALKGSEAGQLLVGDTVTVKGIIKNYNGTIEFDKPQLVEHVEGEGHLPPDESAYTEMNVADARNAEKGTLIKVDGVVAKITYADKLIPSGVYLVDETQCIYVYDGTIASMVEVGNTITVLGEKDYWVLEKEQSSADKFGYKGCNQLSNAKLVNNDKAISDFNKDWITESTVKEIMDNPVENDITTTIFKVNALVKKVEGNGFTNYYFDDLDGVTGSYAYSQASGADFAWLDEFDGKICTVYLSAINAKSTATGCVYRFLPVLVIDEGFTFNKDDAAKFAVQYYGVGQIGAKYTADPAIELTTSVSSELLGFENATLTYTSDNTAVVYIENGVLHCGEVGEANVTITGEYNGKTYSETVKVTVAEAPKYDSITVAEAIVATEDSQVTVKGIVGPSVVNKNGFYLFGEDGSTIAVLVDSTDEFADLEIGHEVILQGKRERYVKDDTNTSIAGQSSIVNAKILVNYYGNHEYSTAKFVEATAAEFYALDKAVDYSTTVFVLTATINYIETDFYTSLELVSGDTKVGLYMSGAGQYKWLQAFTGQEVTMEIAACNWNDKGYWRGCVLAVRTADGKVLNTLNFDTY